jgi:hypothetical protein
VELVEGRRGGDDADPAGLAEVRGHVQGVTETEQGREAVPGLRHLSQEPGAGVRLDIRVGDQA